MNTALVLSHLIVVAALPNGVCTTDTECERIALEYGCVSYEASVTPPPDWQEDDRRPVFLCDRDTFERKQRELAK